METTFFLTQLDELHSRKVETINSSINELKNKMVEEEEYYRIVSSNLFDIENNLNKVGLTISRCYYENTVLYIQAIKSNGKFRFIKSNSSISYNKETGLKVTRLNNKLKENISSLLRVDVNPYSLEYDAEEDLNGKNVLITFYFK